MTDSMILSADERQYKRQQYQILSMLMENKLTFKLAESSQKIADEFSVLNEDERAAKLEELKEFAPKEITHRQMDRSFRRLLPDLVF